MYGKRAAGRKLNILFSVAAVLVMWGVWLIAHAAVRNEYIIPSFADTMRSIGESLSDSYFWTSYGYTMLRAAEGWAIAFVCAVLFSALAAVSDACRRFFDPFVSVFRTVPTMAITLMLLVWTSPRTAPVIVTFLMLFPISYAQLTAAYRSVDPKLIEMAEVYRVPARERILRIYIPQMLPSLFSQAGPNLSLSVKVAVSAEVLAFTFQSVGGILQQASVYNDMPQLFAVTILMLITGGILEFALGNLTRITDRWTRGRHGKEARQ